MESGESPETSNGRMICRNMSVVTNVIKSHSYSQVRLLVFFKQNYARGKQSDTSQYVGMVFLKFLKSSKRSCLSTFYRFFIM